MVLTTQCNRTWELFLTHDSLLVFFNHMINVESSKPDPIIRSYLDTCETCEILPGKLRFISLVHGVRVVLPKCWIIVSVLMRNEIVCFGESSPLFFVQKNIGWCVLCL